MRAPFRANPEFSRLLGGSMDVDLARVALEIAQDAYPGLDPAPYLERLDSYATRVRERCPTNAPPRRLLEQVNWVLYVEERFAGNTEDYYDPRNSYLNEVLDRKVGIPITLSIVYQRVALGAGLALAGLNLPAHFMLRTDDEMAPLFIDPYHEGRILDREGCERQVAARLGRPFELSEAQLAACPPGQVIARLLRNLKAIHTRDGDLLIGLLNQRRLAAVAADVPEESRDHALLALQLDRHAEAVAPLERYLSACPEAPEAEELGQLLRRARREAARWN